MIYDTIIIGGGPAGYFASMYCAYNGLSVAVLEKLGPGGHINTSHNLEEFPGIELVAGPNFGERLLEYSNRFGAKTFIVDAHSIEIDGDLKKVHTDCGTFVGKSVVVATGTSPRRLGIKDEEDLLGRGISYCAACEGGFFAGKEVTVAGCGNNAVADVLHLSNFCKKVYLISKCDAITSSETLYDSVKYRDNVFVLLDTTIVSLIYDDVLTGLALRDNNGMSNLRCDGLFITIGRAPNNELFKDLVDVDIEGYAVAGEDGITKVPGLFVSGDARTKNLRRAMTAASDGINVSKSVVDYVRSL